MKNILIILAIFTLTISCKSQTTYSNNLLKEQSIKINQSQNSKKLKEKKGELTIGDIISQLKVEPLAFSFDHTNPDTNMVNLIIIKFYNTKDTNFLIKNNIESYNIVLILKNEIKRSEVAQVFLDNKKVWNKNVYNYLKDLEILNVQINNR